MKRFLFVGAAAKQSAAQNPGGGLTAALGIHGFAKQVGYELIVVDTLQPSFPQPRFAARLWSGVRRVGSVIRSIVSQRLDGAIFFVGARISFFERMLQATLCRIRGVRTVFFIRDGFFPGWMNSNRYLRRLVGLLLHVPYRIVVQGEGIRQTLISYGAPAHQIEVIRNWLPPHMEVCAVPKRRRPGEPLRLVFVGWVVFEKGVLDLCNAFDLIDPEQEVHLDLIGGGLLEDSLRLRYPEGPAARIRIHGWLDSGAVRDLVDQSHVLVLPSHAEGFPNALLEAAARGLPAIGTNVGAITDLVHDDVNGYVVPVASPQLLAQAIHRYLARPDLLETHSRQTLQLVRELYDRESNLKRVFAIFD